MTASVSGSAASWSGSTALAELDQDARPVGALLDARAVYPRRTAYDHLLAVAITPGRRRRLVRPLLADR
ncbi:hypothetical protein [Streptomyces sp. NPDC048242]|uniref:hypothetical protein n=1 Tax=Streptomyces sp. NPDC048242 TaxID=3155026 RepID=UPI0033DEDD98